MPFIGRIALLLVSTVFAGVAWAGLTDYDADVIDLTANYEERRTTSDQLLLAELNKHLAVNLVMTN